MAATAKQPGLRVQTNPGAAVDHRACVTRVGRPLIRVHIERDVCLGEDGIGKKMLRDYFAERGVMRLCAELRAQGWMVASHNDYPKNNGMRTYWSFSRGNQIIDGDGIDDLEALKQRVRASDWLHQASTR